jgi:threonine/homoserine/homoserine lactone efflux protein
MIFGMDPVLLTAFATTHILLCLTPGPAVMQVVAHTMVNGWRPAQASIFGVLGANGMYCMLAALGMGTLILALPELFEIIKWVGMTYLAWLGIRSLASALRPSRLATPEVERTAPIRLFRQSFLLQGANPKSVLTFCALLPAFVGDIDGAAIRIIALGIIAIVVEYPILLAYSLLASRARRLITTGNGRRLLNAFSGCALIGAAGSVAVTTLQRR